MQKVRQSIRKWKLWCPYKTHVTSIHYQYNIKQTKTSQMSLVSCTWLLVEDKGDFGWSWYLIPAISALKWLTENCHEFKASLGLQSEMLSEKGRWFILFQNWAKTFVLIDNLTSWLRSLLRFYQYSTRAVFPDTILWWVRQIRKRKLNKYSHIVINAPKEICTGIKWERVGQSWGLM